jgi:hypothetical protein
MPAELVPLDGQHSVVLVPKATTDLPFFYLTKQRSSLGRDIEYKGVDTEGRPIHWAVVPSRSPKIGPPGIEAHEVWMRLVKPVIDSRLNLGDRDSYVIPLGKVRECLRAIGWSEGGYQAEAFLKALRQIGAAWCIADLWIPTTQKSESGEVMFAHVKGEFSKMTIYAIGSRHLTEEELNDANFTFDFDLDDTVYVLLNPIEAQIQKDQPQRYIDNQYMFSVTPAAQRWYELLAAKLFGVIKNKGGYCEIRYSWYVKHHHTLKRYYERKRVVFQMNRLVDDHLRKGYISKVEYRVLKEPGQEIDYLIRYYPGEAAKHSIARILSFAHQQHLGHKEYVSVRTTAPRAPREPRLEKRPAPNVDQILLSELTKRGVTHGQAEKLLTQLSPDQKVMDQLEWGDYVVAQGAIKNPPGLYVSFLKDNLIPPDEFQTSRKRRLREAETTALKTKQQQEEQLLAAYEAYRSQEIDKYLDDDLMRAQDLYEDKSKQAQEKFSGLFDSRADLVHRFVTMMVRSEVAKGRILLDTLEQFRSRQMPSAPLLALPAPATPSLEQGSGSIPPASISTAQGPLQNQATQIQSPAAPDDEYFVV